MGEILNIDYTRGIKWSLFIKGKIKEGGNEEERQRQAQRDDRKRQNVEIKV